MNPCSRCNKLLPLEFFKRKGKLRKTCNLCSEKLTGNAVKKGLSKQCTHCHKKFYGDLVTPFWRCVHQKKKWKTCNNCYLKRDKKWLRRLRKHGVFWEDGKVELNGYFTRGCIPDEWVTVEQLSNIF